MGVLCKTSTESRFTEADGKVFNSPRAESTWASTHNDLGSLWPASVESSQVRASSVTDQVAKSYANLLPHNSNIERVYWAYEGDVVRIWTVLRISHKELEKEIYDAQVHFLQEYRHLDCDFSVIFRGERGFEEIKPQEAVEIRLHF